MIICANALHIPLKDNTVQCCVTSPPYYGLRDYGTAKWQGGDKNCDHLGKPVPTRAGFNERYFGRESSENNKQDALRTPYKDICGKCGAIRIDDQIGLEPTPDEYVAKLVQVFREVKRVLKDDGTLWLNIGDSYYGGNGTTPGFHDPKDSKCGRIDTSKRKYDGYKPKDLIGIPWMLAFALRADGWYLRSDIIWHKPNPMPESVKDRPTKAHEYVFLLTKSAKYYYDNEAIFEVATGYDGRKDTMFKGAVKSYNGVMPNGQPQSFAQNGHERWSKRMPPIGGVKAPGKNGNPTYSGNTTEWRKMKGSKDGGGGTGFAKQSGGFNMETGEWMGGNIDGIPARNKRTVWTITTQPFKGAHFAVMPEKLVEPCVLAGSRPGDVILDPFAGSGTVGVVAQKFGRQFIGIELNPEYVKLAEKRLLATPQSLFNQSILQETNL